MLSAGDMKIGAATNEISLKERFDLALEDFAANLDYHYLNSIDKATGKFTQATMALFDPRTYAHAAVKFSENANDAFQVASGVSSFREEFPTLTLLGGLAIGSKEAKSEWNESVATAISGTWADYYLMRNNFAAWFDVTASTFATATPAAVAIAYGAGQCLASGPTVEGIAVDAGNSFLRVGDELMSRAIGGTPTPSTVTINGLLMPVPAVAEAAAEAPAVGGAVAAVQLPSFGVLAGPMGAKTFYNDGTCATLRSGGTPKNVQEIISEADDGYAARLHDEWRSTRKVEEGGGKATDGQPLREARWKAVKADDPSFASTPEQFKRVRTDGGQNVYEVDIANLDYGKLPAKFKFENAEASKGAISIIRDEVAKQGGQQEVVIKIEDASDVVHRQWLDRNRSWAPAEQNKPYSELAEAEKAKDRVIVEGAVDYVNQQFAANGVQARVTLQQ